MLTALVASVILAQATPLAQPPRPAYPRPPYPRPTGQPHRRDHDHRYLPNVYVNAADYLPSPGPSSSPKPKAKNTMKSSAPKQDVFETHQTQF